MPWTTIPAMTTGYLYTAADYNALLKGNLEQLKTRPVARTESHSGTIMTTSSTSWVDVTGMSASVTTSGSSRIAVWGQVIFSGATQASPDNNLVATIAIDGVNQGNGTFGLAYGRGFNPNERFSLTFFCLSGVLSDSAHTAKLQVQVFGTAATMSILGADLMIMEVL